MNNIVGIFTERRDAESAMQDLCSAGFEPDKLILLTPDTGSDTLQRMPSEDAEQPGMGERLAVLPAAQRVWLQEH